MSMASKVPQSLEQLEPGLGETLEEAKEDPKEQLEPEEQLEPAEDEDEVFNGPITRSKQAKLKTTLQHLLKTIEASLVCANPSTLVVIQAT